LNDCEKLAEIAKTKIAAESRSATAG